VNSARLRVRGLGKKNHEKDSIFEGRLKEGKMWVGGLRVKSLELEAIIKEGEALHRPNEPPSADLRQERV